MTSIFNKPKTAASGSRSVVRTGTSAYVSALFQGDEIFTWFYRKFHRLVWECSQGSISKH